jgi:hypothetical protein
VPRLLHNDKKLLFDNKGWGSAPRRRSSRTGSTSLPTVVIYWAGNVSRESRISRRIALLRRTRSATGENGSAGCRYSLEVQYRQATPPQMGTLLAFAELPFPLTVDVTALARPDRCPGYFALSRAGDFPAAIVPCSRW